MWRLIRLWRVAKDDLPLLWAALRHPERPRWLLPVTGLLAVYSLEPLNFGIPLLGVVDDVVLLPLLLHQIVKHLPQHVTSRQSRP